MYVTSLSVFRSHKINKKRCHLATTAVVTLQLYTKIRVCNLYNKDVLCFFFSGRDELWLLREKEFSVYSGLEHSFR